MNPLSFHATVRAFLVFSCLGLHGDALLAAPPLHMSSLHNPTTMQPPPVKDAPPGLSSLSTSNVGSLNSILQVMLPQLVITQFTLVHLLQRWLSPPMLQVGSSPGCLFHTTTTTPTGTPIKLFDLLYCQPSATCHQVAPIPVAPSLWHGRNYLVERANQTDSVPCCDREHQICKLQEQVDQTNLTILGIMHHNAALQDELRALHLASNRIPTVSSMNVNDNTDLLAQLHDRVTQVELEMQMKTRLLHCQNTEIKEITNRIVAPEVLLPQVIASVEREILPMVTSIVSDVATKSITTCITEVMNRMTALANRVSALEFDAANLPEFGAGEMPRPQTPISSDSTSCKTFSSSTSSTGPSSMACTVGQCNPVAFDAKA